MFKYTFLLMFGIIIVLSCTKEACEDKQLPVFSMEDEYGCENTKYQMNIVLFEQFTILRNQSEFDLLVSGSCDVQVDFTKFDLVIGKRGLTNGNTRIEYELWDRCDMENLQLGITFYQNITTEAPNLTYHALVEKLETDAEIDITISEKFE